MRKFHDVKADHEKREYYVVERDTGKVVATFRYKRRSELDRGRAHGMANFCRARLNAETFRDQETC